MGLIENSDADFMPPSLSSTTAKAAWNSLLGQKLTGLYFLLPSFSPQLRNRTY
jgi:hypothetical protein